MKLKLDENLPGELVDLFAAGGHDVHTVADENMVGQEDGLVLQAAVDERRILVTQDLDFSDTRKFKPGAHPGIVLIRLRNPSRRRIIVRVQQLLLDTPIDSWAGCFVVVGDVRLRIRRP